MSTNPFPSQPEPGADQTPPASSVPPPGAPPSAPYGTPYGTSYGGDPNRGPGTGSDRFFDSIRRIGLARSDDRWVGGVAGGLAERLGWDPLLVRGLLFLSFFVTGIGLVVYAVGWALLPERRDGRIHLQQAIRGDFDIALLGAGLALIAGFSQADGIGWWRTGWGDWGWLIGLFWVAVWVIAGVWLVRYLRDRRRDRATGTYPVGGPYPPYPTQGGPADWSAQPSPSAGTSAASSPTESVSSPVPPAGPTASFTAPVPPAQPVPPYGDPRLQAAQARVEAAKAQAAARAEAARATAAARAEAAKARAQATREEAQARAFAAKQRAEARAAERASRPITKGAGAGTIGVAFGLILVAGALLLAADRSGFRFPAPFDGAYDAALLWVGVSLTILGAAIVVSGIRGRSSGWLGFLAIVGLVVALPWSATVGDPDVREFTIRSAWDGWPGVERGLDISDGTVVPRSVAEAERGFRAQFGDPTIDLSGLDLTAATTDDPVEVPIQLSAGDLTVVVPRDIAVEADVRLLAGQVTWRVDDGERTLNRVGSSVTHLRSDEASDDGAILRLLVSAGAGNVTVEEN